MTEELPGLRHREAAYARRPKVWTPEHLAKVEQMRRTAAEPYRGITTSEGLTAGLFPLSTDGEDVRIVRDAAVDYLASLSPGQEADGCFGIEDDSWRHWANGARFHLRHGLCLQELEPAQRSLALTMIRHSLSAAGFLQLIDVMHLNRSLGEIREELDDLNEWMYWLSIYGSPRRGAPWGWQLDGHHANLNCVLVADQMTLTPSFLGSEPVSVTSGKYAGTAVFRSEESDGLGLFRSLDDSQQSLALISAELPRDLYAGSLRDNLELNYRGLCFADLSTAQLDRATELVSLYIGRTRVQSTRLAEVKNHYQSTYFAWAGGDRDESVFYYRIHSPVVLIEFEHQRGVMFDNDEPSRRHIHTLVRTPNGNDYGRDLLRQHHERFHSHAAAAQEQ